MIPFNFNQPPGPTPLLQTIPIVQTQFWDKSSKAGFFSLLISNPKIFDPENEVGFIFPANRGHSVEGIQ